MSTEPRNLNSPAYNNWRNSVFTLFDFTCCLCNKKGGHLEAHHIERWADNEKLRYSVSNGACLCIDCHKMVTGKEAKYADFFGKAVRLRLETKRQLASKNSIKEIRKGINKKTGYKRPKGWISNPRCRF